MTRKKLQFVIGPLKGSIFLERPLQMRILETTRGPIINSPSMRRSFIGLINPAPRKAMAMSGVMIRAPRYDPMVPRSANCIFPLRKSANGMTATAGGTEARRIKPFQKFVSLMKSALNPIRIMPWRRKLAKIPKRLDEARDLRDRKASLLIPMLERVMTTARPGTINRCV